MIDSGQSDPESIAILLGLPSSVVEAYLDKRKQNRSAKQLLLDEIQDMDALISVAREQYQAFSNNQNAQAIRTLLGARRDLIKDLAENEDPSHQIASLDAQVLAPLVRDLLLGNAKLIALMRDEIRRLMPEENWEAVNEALRRNYSVVGHEMETAYQRSITHLAQFFVADVSIDDLESSQTFRETNVIDLSEERRKRHPEREVEPDPEPDHTQKKKRRKRRR